MVRLNPVFRPKPKFSQVHSKETNKQTIFGLMKVKLRFSAPSAGIAEIAKR